MLALPNNEPDQNLMIEYELTRQEIAAIDQQIKQLQEHHAGLLGAKEGLESLKGQAGSELLIPGGAGIYFNTTLSNDKSALINVGANILVEMNLVKATKTINERVDQALSMIFKLNEEAELMIGRLQQLEMAIQSSQQQPV